MENTDTKLSDRLATAFSLLTNPFNPKGGNPDGVSLTHHIPCASFLRLSILKWMADVKNTNWARAREAEDGEDVKVLLATHIKMLEKGVEEGFGGVREVLGLLLMRREGLRGGGGGKPLVLTTLVDRVKEVSRCLASFRRLFKPLSQKEIAQLVKEDEAMMEAYAARLRSIVRLRQGVSDQKA